MPMTEIEKCPSSITTLQISAYDSLFLQEANHYFFLGVSTYEFSPLIQKYQWKFREDILFDRFFFLFFKKKHVIGILKRCNGHTQFMSPAAVDIR